MPALETLQAEGLRVEGEMSWREERIGESPVPEHECNQR